MQKLQTNAKELSLAAPTRAWHLPDWPNLSQPQRLGVIRRIAMARGRDLRIARLAVQILKAAGVKPRDYKAQAATLLKWVQDPRNIYFVNEPGERLQDPIYTLFKAKQGDCDDICIALSSLFESINLPWRLVLAGLHEPTQQKVRFIESVGQPLPNTRWAHVYLMVGVPPGKATEWYFCEPTVQGVPLGWDVVSGDAAYLPELAKKKKGPPQIRLAPPAPRGFRPKAMPLRQHRSPAYDLAYGDAISLNPASSSRTSSSVGGAVGGAIASSSPSSPSSETTGGVDWQRIGEGILTGVIISVGTSLLLDWVNGAGLWEGKGHAVKRWTAPVVATLSESALIAPVEAE